MVGLAGLMVGLSDFRGLFQPKWHNDSGILENLFPSHFFIIACSGFLARLAARNTSNLRSLFVCF